MHLVLVLLLSQQHVRCLPARARVCVCVYVCADVCACGGQE